MNALPCAPTVLPALVLPRAMLAESTAPMNPADQLTAVPMSALPSTCAPTVLPAPDQTTVQDVFGMYLALEAGKLAPLTQSQVRGALDQFGREFGADRTVASIRRIEVVAWLAKHPEWKSAHTRRQHVAYIGRAFAWAMEMDLVFRNPFWRIKTGTPMLRRAIEDAEFLPVLRASPAYFRRILIFLQRSGARTCEARELCWKDVNLERGVCTLAHHKTAYKTGKPRRIPLDPVLVRMLQWMRRNYQARYGHSTGKMTLGQASERLAELLARGPAHNSAVSLAMAPASAQLICRAAAWIGATVRFLGHAKGAEYAAGPRNHTHLPPGKAGPAPEAPVFTNQGGKPWTANALGQRFRRTIQNVGQDRGMGQRATPYMLRHALATRAIMNKVPLLTLSKIMGHCSVAVTERFYIHIDDQIELLQEALQLANRKGAK